MVETVINHNQPYSYPIQNFLFNIDHIGSTLINSTPRKKGSRKFLATFRFMKRPQKKNTFNQFLQPRCRRRSSKRKNNELVTSHYNNSRKNKQALLTQLIGSTSQLQFSFSIATFFLLICLSFLQSVLLPIAIVFLLHGIVD